jgi:hypothetical protein
MDDNLQQTTQTKDSSLLTSILKRAKHKNKDSGNDSLDGRARKKAKVTDKSLSDDTPINAYAGWTVPCHNHKIERVEADNLTPRVFYEKFVKRRRPTILHGNLESIGSIANLKKWKSIEYLKATAGSAMVTVEKRTSALRNSAFGKGNEISMTFGEFLDLVMVNGNPIHYLTTQDVEANGDGRPDLMAPFMKCFRDDFPLRPKIMGQLIPQNINLWMGNNVDGASSGLHHDYHDNLYIVLKGKKRFRLFSPGDTEKMYTRGSLLRVHPNGRINYKDEETTAYGADLTSDDAAKASLAKVSAEEMLSQAEQEVAQGVKGSLQRLEQAEEAMDEALSAILDAEADNEDFDESDEDENNYKCGLFGGNGKLEDLTDDEEDDVVEKSDQEIENQPRRLVDKTVKNPDNFSRVEHTLLDNSERLKLLYPNILEAKVAFCNVEEGEVLYLPASWFHEVTSYGSNMAMNYWFHPPDASDNFETPYSTDFWQNDFRQRFET